MSLSSTTNRNDYVGNGATATYAYGFKIYLSSELRVTVVNTAGAETQLVINTDYTVTGVGSVSGGNVVLVNASQAWLTSGFLTTAFGLTVRRVRALTQLADIRNQGEFYPETHEDVFDKMVMNQQQLQDELDRAVRLPETEAGSATFVLPGIDDRANQLLGFDADGDPIAAAAVSATVSAFMQTVLDDTTAAAALTTLGVSAYHQTLLDDTTAAATRTTLGHAHTTTGDIEYASSSTALARLGIGTSGQRLGVSSSSLPQWQDDPAPNVIINGDFDFWQRGTSFAAAVNGSYHADRFNYVEVGASAHTLSRSAFTDAAANVPTLAQSGHQSSYSVLADCTTADASIAASDLAQLETRLEGYTWASLKGKTVTLSFWVKATKTGTSCVSFVNGGFDRSYPAEFTINTTATWEKKTVTLVLNPTGGTEYFTTGIGLVVSFCLYAGTDYQGTAASWQTGNFKATANQVNHCDSTSNDFRIAQVKLEVGSNATTFDRCGRSIAEELALCQRYYEKNYDVNTVPGTAGTSGMFNFRSSSTAVVDTIVFKQRKRTTPTGVFYSPDTGTSGKITHSGGDVAATPSYVGDACMVVSISGSDQFGYYYYWTADAEL